MASQKNRPVASEMPRFARQHTQCTERNRKINDLAESGESSYRFSGMHLTEKNRRNSPIRDGFCRGKRWAFDPEQNPVSDRCWTLTGFPAGSRKPIRDPPKARRESEPLGALSPRWFTASTDLLQVSNRKVLQHFQLTSPQGAQAFPWKVGRAQLTWLRREPVPRFAGCALCVHCVAVC